MIQVVNRKSKYQSSRVGPGNTGSSVSLHLDGLDITSLHAFLYVGEVGRSGDLPSLQELPLASVTFDFQRTIMMLSYDTEPFAEGSTLHLAIGFEADIGSSIRDMGYGLYKVPCQEGSTKYCWWVVSLSCFIGLHPTPNKQTETYFEFNQIQILTLYHTT